MQIVNIHKCSKGHFFTSNTCPFCGDSTSTPLEVREGDCVKCGQLCADGTYACNEPEPLYNIITSITK